MRLSNIFSIKFNGSVVVLYLFGKKIWQAGNFISRDNKLIETADGKIFNAKEK